MAEIHGVAGEWARVKGTVAGLWPMFLGTFAAGFTLSVACFRSVGWGATLFAVSLIGIGIALYRGLRHVERFFKGARGEERVAGILHGLSDRYHVFNDFIAGSSHVDHVVVGPAGVFAVETKNWKGVVTIEEGRILIDGQLPTRSPLDQVLREARQVKTALARSGWTGPVTPILAFASDTFKAHIAELQGAVVINASDLAKSFETDRAVIPPTELERLVSLMANT